MKYTRCFPVTHNNITSLKVQLTLSEAESSWFHWFYCIAY